MDNLYNDISKNDFKRIYLLFGEERFIIKKAENALKKALLPVGMEDMNYTCFEGKNTSAASVMEASDNVPFFSDKRLIVVKESGLYYDGKKDETDLFADYIEKIPETTVIVFIESKIDRKKRIYKQTAKHGRCIQANRLEKGALVKELSTLTSGRLSSSDAVYMISRVGDDLTLLTLEADKLTNYKPDGKITKKDIDIVCSLSADDDVFKLITEIGNQNIGSALKIYDELIVKKESPMGILRLMIRQFRLIRECKYLIKTGKNNSEIASLLKIPPFTVKNYAEQAKKFKYSVLREAMKACIECDNDIKTGKIPQKEAVEMLILTYGYA